jgi:hypothetical protein
MSDLISSRREKVKKDYDAAEADNKEKFDSGDPKATSEYIYPNQKEDAFRVVHEFYVNKKRIVSIAKKTKVGADGLMIEIAKLMTTHTDDDFVVNFHNIRIITGMSNIDWQEEMKNKSPNFLKDKIYHHGQLKNSNLEELKNSLIIIDEIDTGDKEGQILHKTLEKVGILNIERLEENNNYIVVISATILQQLYHLHQWGAKSENIIMTIPENYIGHIDFLNREIIQEFYSLKEEENIKKWIQEDILDYYKDDYRVHIVRVNDINITMMRDICISKNIIFRNHIAADKLSDLDKKEFCSKDPLKKHVVIAVKGLFRRANLIPNDWKRKIGAMHELYTNPADNNVQIQGLVGRMTGYWKDIIDSGHKTGPYRTSIKSMRQYDDICKDPFGNNSYHTASFIKNKGKVTISKPSFLNATNIEGLTAVDLPITPHHKCAEKISIITVSVEIIKEIQDKTKKKNFGKEVLEKYIKPSNQSLFDKYNDYTIKIWNMDTDKKRSKWGLSKMKERNAYSRETNIHREFKHENILMIYIHGEENELILSPWNGEINED